MPGFRVTKYDPAFRSSDGQYVRDDWTSIADIGCAFGGRVLDVTEYLRTETAYVTAVRLFMNCARLSVLVIRDLQVNSAPVEDLAESTAERISKVTDGTEVRGDDLDWIVRLALREAIWCRLEGSNGFYVHFGYDYYMYVGATESGLAASKLPPGIFAEDFESPWQREQDAR